MHNRAELRVADAGDTPEMTRLCNELGYDATQEDMTSRFAAIAHSDTHFVAVAPGDSGRLLGWIAAEHRLLLEAGERVEIVALVVDREARRTGVGRALVGAVEAWASARGLSTIFVRSNTKRSESHGFYDGIGYTRTKTQHAYMLKLPREEN